MPVTAIPNTGSQLDRAICAYLISGGCGDAASVTPAHTTSVNVYPNISVKSFQGTHDEQGNEVWQVQIQAEASASNAVGASNPEAKRVALDNLIGLALSLMLQTGDDQTTDEAADAMTAAGRALKTAQSYSPKDWASPENNTDMADFTATHIYYKSMARGTPNEEGSAWVEIRTFEVHCCPSNVD